jgi:[acyl-carrier-protein] S-malonyltransferase
MAAYVESMTQQLQAQMAQLSAQQEQYAQVQKHMSEQLAKLGQQQQQHELQMEEHFKLLQKMQPETRPACPPDDAQVARLERVEEQLQHLLRKCKTKKSRQDMCLWTSDSEGEATTSRAESSKAKEIQSTEEPKDEPREEALSRDHVIVEPQVVLCSAFDASLVTQPVLESMADTLPIGILFPGQGSACKNMLSSVKTVPAVKEMLNHAQNTLGFDLVEHCAKSSESELRKCLPALFIAGLAGLERLRRENAEAVSRARGIAGKDVGEITALCAAGVFTFEDGFRLVIERAEALADVTATGKHSSLLITGMERWEIKKMCAEATNTEGAGAVCQIAEELFPLGFCVAGTQPAVQYMMYLVNTKKDGAQAKRLAREGAEAMGTPLMAPAQDRMNRVFRELLPSMKTPTISVYLSSLDACLKPGTPPEEIVEMLSRHMIGPLLWEAPVRSMINEGVAEFYEVGPMQQLKTLMKRIDRKTWSNTTSITV